jgi:hypothetical protein
MFMSVDAKTGQTGTSAAHGTSRFTHQSDTPSLPDTKLREYPLKDVFRIHLAGYFINGVGRLAVERQCGREL